MLKECFRCHKDIDLDKDEYFIFTEHKGKSKVHTDHCHKLCWNLFLEKVGNVSESMNMIRGLKGYLGKLGVFPEQQKEYAI